MHSCDNRRLEVWGVTLEGKSQMQISLRIVISEWVRRFVKVKKRFVKGDIDYELL